MVGRNYCTLRRSWVGDWVLCKLTSPASHAEIGGFLPNTGQLVDDLKFCFRFFKVETEFPNMI